MNKEFIKNDYLGLVSVLLSIFGLVLTLYFNNDQTVIILNNIIFPILLFSTAIILGVINFRIYRANRTIVFYKDRRKQPSLFDVKKMLVHIAKKRYNLSVIGRTNISWFDDIDEISELYKSAIKNGCKIQFVIQRKDVKNFNLTQEATNKIINDYSKVIEKYKKLYETLDNTKNISLLLTNEIIENSMTKVSSPDNSIVYFSYDIGQNIANKPFIVFYKNSVFEELKKKFDSIVKNSIQIQEYESTIKKANEKVTALLKSFPQHSYQRNNQNSDLIPHIKRRKLAAKNGQIVVPPITVQVLITNNCTTTCIMCSHGKIKSDRELNDLELRNTLRCIQEAGTKNIIISGGEPLAKENCIDLIEFAKNKLELNVGLLTNGIKPNNEPLSRNDAIRLKESCAWIQISIDSFIDENYRAIRKSDLKIVKESLKNLENADANVEICFTIQKQNIDEAIDIVKGKNTIGFKSKIRFKFAHGPDINNNFLEKDEKKLTEFIQNCSNSEKYNSKYLVEMVEEGYFNYEDLANGTPLKTKSMDFNRQGFTCQILNYSCKVDHEGNVYPCCFLFDDNKASSDIRNKYIMGSLRSTNSKKVMPPDNGKNKFKEIWFNRKKRESLLSDKLPIENEACFNCTRHFYQNDFLNQIEQIFSKYEKYGYDYSHDHEINEQIWI